MSFDISAQKKNVSWLTFLGFDTVKKKVVSQLFEFITKYNEV